MSASKQHSLEPPGTKEVCVYLQALFCWMFLRKTGTGKEPKESPPHSTQIQNPAHFWDFFFPSKAKALNCWGSGENPPVPKVLSEIPRPWERRGKAACHWGGLMQEPLLLWEGQDTLSPAIPDKGALPYGRSGSKSHLSLEDKQKTYSGQDPALTQSRGQLPLKEERETLTQDTLPPPQIKEKYSSPRGKKQEHGESPTSKAHANGPAWAWGWTRRREDFTAPTKSLQAAKVSLRRERLPLRQGLLRAEGEVGTQKNLRTSGPTLITELAATVAASDHWQHLKSVVWRSSVATEKPKPTAITN